MTIAASQCMIKFVRFLPQIKYSNRKKSDSTNYIFALRRWLIKFSVSVDGSVGTNVDNGLVICVDDGSGVFSDLEIP